MSPEKGDYRDLRGRGHREDEDDVLFNYQAHQRAHPGEIKVMTYTSVSSLDTSVMEPPIYPILPGRILNVRCNVAGAPSSTLTLDVLIDGSTIYTVSEKPTIASGTLKGDPKPPDLRQFTTDSKIALQLTATGSATGPIVVQIKCFVAIETEMVH